MTVTGKLVRVYQVDKQIRGLRSRLTAAERFLNEQTRILGELATRKTAVEGQLRQITASASNEEGEVARISERIEELRERMNNARTNKEYKALLTEVNTLKEQRSTHEDGAISRLEQIDKLKSQLADIESQHAERTRMREVAESERQQRADEIKDRLKALESEREQVIEDVPNDVLKTYEELVEQREDEAMAPIEIADRKRHEFHCGACMMTLPVESMSALLSHGSLTRCVSCGCILYLEENTRESMTAKK
ncbi:MAG: hypothetical protein R3B57_13840 [Phycisphaerales bacterium]